MKRFFLPLFLVITIHFATAQNTDCKVLLDSLKGTYEGECKNGKANGRGKAVGVNVYDGEFKNGLPEGRGRYTWSNNDFYYGNWRKGLKEGKGEFHSFENGNEELLTGYWRRDKYSGEYENPYIIQNVTTDIGRVQVSRISNTDKSVRISVSNLAGGAGSPYSSQPHSIATMSGFQITRGSYMTKTTSTLTNKDITAFQGVVFPFRGTFNFGNSIFEIEIFEEGGWDITVPINK